MQMRITFPGGKRVDASFNGFTINTDQHPMGGGDGSAPEPFATFLASIGTCAGIYVLGFCQARGLPTEGIELVQTNEFADRRLARVTIDIRVPPTFPDKYLDALRRVADQCAVKKALQSPPEMVTTSTVVYNEPVSAVR
jgi:ribosomal protein S12 methylthiotransferase accessory factor